MAVSLHEMRHKMQPSAQCASGKCPAIVISEQMWSQLSSRGVRTSYQESLQYELPEFMHSRAFVQIGGLHSRATV